MITISESKTAFPDDFPGETPHAAQAVAQDAASDQTRFQCRHIFTQGRRCCGPCLRGEEFCYHHHTTRVPVYNARQRRARQSTALATPGSLTLPDLPMPEDRAAIGLAAGQILHAIAANTIDIRRAGMMLYALQIANCALSRQVAKSLSEKNIEEEPVDAVVHHPDLGVIAPRSEFEEPEQAQEPKQRPSFARLLLEDMKQHEQLGLARKRIRELEARLSGYEPVTATVDLNASGPTHPGTVLHDECTASHEKRGRSHLPRIRRCTPFTRRPVASREQPPRGMLPSNPGFVALRSVVCHAASRQGFTSESHPESLLKKLSCLRARLQPCRKRFNYSAAFSRWGTVCL